MHWFINISEDHFYVADALPLVSRVAHKMQWRGYLNTIIFRLVKQKLISCVNKSTAGFQASAAKYLRTALYCVAIHTAVKCIIEQ
jgi:hypothetical protein